MTSANTDVETSAADVNEPDGVSEMFERREQRKARRRGRKPRTLPEPRHPRPPANEGTADETGADDGTVTSDDTEAAEPEPAPAAEAGPSEQEPAVDAAGGEPEPEQLEAETAPAAPEPPTGHSASGQAVSVPPAAAGTAKAASDAALSWAAAARKQALRLEGLATAMRRARAEGIPPLVLSATLADAEYRAGLPLPPEVWAAAEAGHG